MISAGTKSILVSACLLATVAGCSGSGSGDTPTSPSPTVVVTNLAGSWSGTQTSVSSTSGNLCVHELIANLIRRGLSETLEVKVIQFQDLITITPKVGSTNGGSYEGRITGSDFSAGFKANTGALGVPTFCAQQDFFIVEKGGAMQGRIGTGTLSGTGTRTSYITDRNLRQVGEITITYQFSLRK